SQGTRPETPSPVPGPRTPIGASAIAMPPPTAKRSSSVNRGRASASAVKSLITSSRSKPNRSFNARIEKSPAKGEGGARSHSGLTIGSPGPTAEGLPSPMCSPPAPDADGGRGERKHGGAAREHVIQDTGPSEWTD